MVDLILQNHSLIYINKIILTFIKMLLSFYKCYVSDLPDEVYIYCVNNVEEGMINLCDMIHFNDIEDNQNIIINDGIIKIYTGKKWVMRNRNMVIDDIIVDKINILDNYFNNNKNKFTEDEQQTYTNSIIFLNNYRNFSFYKDNPAKELYSNIYTHIDNKLD
jgi:hypothetical protein